MLEGCQEPVHVCVFVFFQNRNDTLHTGPLERLCLLPAWLTLLAPISLPFSFRLTEAEMEPGPRVPIVPVHLCALSRDPGTSLRAFRILASCLALAFVINEVLLLSLEAKGYLSRTGSAQNWC